MSRHPFRDRRDAGSRLAAALQQYRDRDDTTVLGLPRGGVPVAYEVARGLHAPLDVFVVRKLRAPGHPELAMGAVASGGVTVLNDEVLADLDIEQDVVSASITAARRELAKRERRYRGSRAPAELRGRTVLLVDDGLATGASMRAAVTAVRAHAPAAVVVAVPVASRASAARLAQAADDVVCLSTPSPFFSVGESYDDFGQTTDTAVVDLLAAAVP